VDTHCAEVIHTARAARANAEAMREDAVIMREVAMSALLRAREIRQAIKRLVEDREHA